MVEEIKTPPRETPNRPDAPLAGGGFLASLVAMLSASCCVLPVLLVQAGVSAALVGQIGVLAPYRAPLLFAAGATIAIAAAAAFWGGRKPRPRVLAMLALSGGLVVGAYLLPLFETELLGWILRR
jgi:mercuric ion transport protein